MKKVLCGPNRYEITVKTLGKAIKSHGKAEKPVRRANFVSKWYVIHMIYSLNRYEINKTREQPGFSPFFPQKTPLFHRFSPLFNDRTFPEKHQNK